MKGAYTEAGDEHRQLVWITRDRTHGCAALLSLLQVKSGWDVTAVITTHRHPPIAGLEISNGGVVEIQSK